MRLCKIGKQTSNHQSAGVWWYVFNKSLSWSERLHWVVIKRHLGQQHAGLKTTRGSESSPGVYQINLIFSARSGERSQVSTAKNPVAQAQASRVMLITRHAVRLRTASSHCCGMTPNLFDADLHGPHKPARSLGLILSLCQIALYVLDLLLQGAQQHSVSYGIARYLASQDTKVRLCAVLAECCCSRGGSWGLLVS